MFTYGLTGLRWREDHVRLDPMLPPQLSRGVTLKGLRWQGRTFDVAIGAQTTTVTLRAGDPFTVRWPSGSRERGRLAGDARDPPPRPRPDQQPRPLPGGDGSSEEPGMDAEAAVDGSAATAWGPRARRARSRPTSVRGRTSPTS